MVATPCRAGLLAGGGWGAPLDWYFFSDSIPSHRVLAPVATISALARSTRPPSSRTSNGGSRTPTICSTQPCTNRVPNARACAVRSEVNPVIPINDSPCYRHELAAVAGAACATCVLKVWTMAEPEMDCSFDLLLSLSQPYLTTRTASACCHRNGCGETRTLLSTPG